jgi:crotonobetainyl-CoA:carnitine CoA-transferase CaiB-like acyl-CoA transferase
LRQAPPDLGEHSEEIARELGYSEEEIEELVAKGLLGERPKAAIC